MEKRNQMYDLNVDGLTFWVRKSPLRRDLMNLCNEPFGAYSMVIKN